MSKEWWEPTLTDAAWLARIRVDYPSHDDDSDEYLIDYYADGRKYAVTWDHVGDAYNDYEPLADAYTALTAECAALRKDAERYRWLSGDTKRVCRIHVEANVLHAKGLGQPEAIDAAIDAAMGESHE